MHDELTNTLEIRFNWHRLALHSVWAAAICILIAVASFFSDHRILAYILALPHGLKALSSGITSVVLFYFAWRIQNSDHPILRVVFELFACAALFASLYQTAAALGDETHLYNDFCLLSVFLTGMFACITNAQTVWLVVLLALGFYICMETGYVSGWGVYFLGKYCPRKYKTKILLLNTCLMNMIDYCQFNIIGKSLPEICDKLAIFGRTL